MKLVYLNQFQSIKPMYSGAQNDLLSWIIKGHQLAELNGQHQKKMQPELIEKMFCHYSVKSSKLSQRYLEIEDFLTNNFLNNEIYKINNLNPNGSNITDRARFFSRRAFEVFKEIYNFEAPLQLPNHLIHVTCTGYVSPSAAQKIVSSEKWNQETDITHAYHMGCYAAVSAVRLAKNIVISESINNNNFKTDIVHNEMCGLHMNLLAHTPEQIVIQTLFGDGHIKYSATVAKEKGVRNLKIITVLEKIIPFSGNDMCWIPAPWGMEMNLSREVPTKIKKILKEFVNSLFLKANITQNESVPAIYAIHPGGPKIIDSVQEVLALSNEQIKESNKIFFERGNMSSATLPHIWNEIINNHYPIGTRVISLAFGPGLTLLGSIFEVC